ncbi:helix-turn-helix domain-containing protein [Actinoalloteichus hymeniacidonis]|uniref:Transcriptional regulator n=1 Tax=Actinoalloteichus hymeniacidonis TaxID=340345 RepID=A0AAC9HU25_9PSEU|nr:MerR family transcriptional regulator [Actinoalloteichus hymeniacidonis]AOS64911.1 putative transcriptional regulator [Actinoalloteichus hymeniacidonis]MBB5907014.1 DNA-binding transcriptional MerR regulator [Actinoalloteichus hymeniacidonis]
MWSTKQLADLAGTTTKAIRYYHRAQLLDEPERGHNGYKQYRAQHLLQLLRIRRLTELGLSPASAASALENDNSSELYEALTAAERELTAAIDKFNAMREDVRGALAGRSFGDLALQLSDKPPGLSEKDFAVLLVMSRLFDAETVLTFQEILHSSPRTPVDEAFDALSPNADRKEREAVAEMLAEQTRTRTPENPPYSTRGQGLAEAVEIMEKSIAHLYNDAQIEAIRRSWELLRAQKTASDT